MTYPDWAGAVTVTFNTTAATPADGTPPRPVTRSAVVDLAFTEPTGAPLPVRVSNSRAGVNATNPVPFWVYVDKVAATAGAGEAKPTPAAIARAAISQPTNAIRSPRKDRPIPPFLITDQQWTAPRNPGAARRPSIREWQGITGIGLRVAHSTNPEPDA
ncbi:hypothetical protein BN12_70040 [Nostocoides japonicum T1-X7]|uniref:Uncharacterized protein n=1 Tax=Nostocoides japonicum T1-X7 TaxID=1194083 RepID=A0A077M791_9MICO|nr:hypothetical protein BN12_70040 [Tetrasphaera japonica T1-X7]